MKNPLCPALLILGFIVSMANVSFAADVPDYFAKLNPAHPRILITPQREAEVKELVQKDEFLQKLLQNQMLEADELDKAEKLMADYTDSKDELMLYQFEYLKRKKESKA